MKPQQRSARVVEPGTPLFSPPPRVVCVLAKPHQAPDSKATTRGLKNLVNILPTSGVTIRTNQFDERGKMRDRNSKLKN